jgi:two-component system, NtrC family, sensor kinase
MSAPPDSTLTDPEQIIADLRRELIERTAERDQLTSERDEAWRRLDEAQARETATAEVLGVINSSPGELAPVFQAMLEKALRLCGADLGNLLTYDGECFEAVVGIYGATSVGEREVARGRFRPARSGGLLDRLVEGEHFIHTENVRTVAAYKRNPEFRTLVDGGGYLSTTHVALRKDAQLLGVIVIFFKEHRKLTEKQIGLLENFAAQAVIAMENARLITETREALEQQTATAEVLGVINSSPGDLSPVFNAMLERAMRLCQASIGLMFTVDGDHARIVAERDMPAKLSNYLAENPPRIGPDTFFGRSVLEREVLHTTDMTLERPYKSGSPLAVATVELGGVRSMLMVPLLKDNVVRGTFAIFRREARMFTEKEIALSQNFAAQAVIAMDNARLITETREALEQQTATAEVLQVINSSPGDLAPVFEAMLERTMRLCKAGFGELDVHDGKHFRVAATLGVPAAFEEYRRDNPSEPRPGSFGGRLVAGEEVIHIIDLTRDELYSAGNRNRRAIVELGGARTVLVAPLRKDATVLGFIILYRQEVRGFADQQIALLRNFAAQAVIAMENARLLGDLRERTDDLTEALEYQTATSNVLEVISRSTFDLQPVLDTLVATAAQLCNSHSSALTIREAMSFAMPPPIRRRLSGTPSCGNGPSLRDAARRPGAWRLKAKSCTSPMSRSIRSSTCPRSQRSGIFAPRWVCRCCAMGR